MRREWLSGCKKGTQSVGVQRQYTGTAGRIENAQVAVYAVWAGRRGAAFIDRELYIPSSWTTDPARCAAAGLPADLVFATKPALALRIVQRTVAAGAVPGFVAGDEVYGNDPQLRVRLVGIGCVLAVACTATVALATGPVGAAVLAVGLPEIYTSWCRWTVLAMLAHAFLTVLAAEQPDLQEDVGMVALTRNETAHLPAALLFAHDRSEQHRWRWSAWRRRHQLRARHCHYQRQ